MVVDIIVKKSPPRRGFSDRINVMCFSLAGTFIYKIFGSPVLSMVYG
jgi:hypothetical protein